MLCRLSSVLAFAAVTSAHFVLQWPPTAGFDDDNEGKGPCGGVDVSVNSSSPQVSVGRFAASIRVTHPTGLFGFYATTNTQAPYDFVPISQNVSSSGIGTFCENYLSVPSSFAGKAGVIQVIDYSIDGVLYQCAPVNFVSGRNDTLGSSCTNSTGQSLSWTGTFVPSASNNTSATPAGSTTATSASPVTTAVSTSSRSSTAGAAIMTLAAPVLGGLGAFAAGMIL